MVSAVVCTKNSENSIVACIKSLKNQRRPPDEIVLVDGNSADRTVELATDMGVDRVIYDGGRGLGYARQLGAESSKGDLVCFIDSDTWSPPWWLEMMLAELEKDSELVAVQDYYVSVGRNWVAELESYFFNVSTFRALKRKSVEATGIENSIWRRDVFTEIKFDHRFRLLEDLDFLYRVNRMGLKTLRTPNVFHIHFPRESLRESYDQYIHRGYYTALFHLKHGLKKRNLALDVLLTPLATLNISLSATVVEKSLSGAGVFLVATLKRAAFMKGYYSFKASMS